MNNRISSPFKQFGDEVYFTYLNDIKSDFAEHLGCRKCLDGSAMIVVAILNYVLGPIYFLSKIVNLLMPFIIVLYLGIAGNINYFVDIDIFLVIIWCLYVIVIISWLIALYLVLNEEYYAWHILPSTKHLRTAWNGGSGATLDEVRNKIHDNYAGVTLHPLIQRQIKEQYGGDITTLILAYLDSICLTYRECLIESLLDDLFGISITNIILDYHNDMKLDFRGFL